VTSGADGPNAGGRTAPGTPGRPPGPRGELGSAGRRRRALLSSAPGRRRLALPATLRTRLTLASLLVTGAAILAVYVYVVPQLRTRLQDEKLRALQVATSRQAPAGANAIARNRPQRQVGAAVRTAAAAAGDRVVLLGVSTGTLGVSVFPIADSAQPQGRTGAGQGQVVARRAVSTGRPEAATELTRDGRVAEAARPLVVGGRMVGVLVISSPLSDLSGNTAVVRRQILVAGGIALVVAVLGGFFAARALSRRVKRLETAAREVAAGDFSHPIPVDSDDEIAELAVAFNDMQRQLAQLDSARKQFIATASHELRTPLFSLGGFVELLCDEDLDEATRDRFLAQLRVQTTRLTKLAVELLDLSRLDAGSLELRPVNVDVGQLARTVATEFIPALTQHDSELELRLRQEPIEVVCDPDRVAQIMRILIDNAIAHTPPGTSIQVRAAREDGELGLAVRDHGTGIASDALNRIFEPFYTADDARGSGLGLAIARELAARMSGEITVDSRPGRTTFTLELPAR